MYWLAKSDPTTCSGLICGSTGNLSVFAEPTKPGKGGEEEEEGVNLQSATPHAWQPRQPNGSFAQLRQFGSLIVWLSQAQAPGFWLVVGLVGLPVSVGLGRLVVEGCGGTQSSTPYDQHQLIVPPKVM